MLAADSKLAQRKLNDLALAATTHSLVFYEALSNPYQEIVNKQDSVVVSLTAKRIFRQHKCKHDVSLQIGWKTISLSSDEFQQLPNM